MSNGDLSLTGRAVAVGAGIGVVLLTGAALAAHVAFTLAGVDDGGVVASLLQVTVGAVVGALGAVVAFLFGGRSAN